MIDALKELTTEELVDKVAFAKKNMDFIDKQFEDLANEINDNTTMERLYHIRVSQMLLTRELEDLVNEIKTFDVELSARQIVAA